MAVPHETARVRSGEVSIHFRKLGAPGGLPLLIVHGLSYFSYDWLAVAHALGGERQVIAMDMRGFGDSDWSPSKDYSVPAMASDIVAVLDQVRWPRAVLVGHSMGGRSAAYVAAKYPQRAAGLVLVDYTPENAPAGSRRVSETVGKQPDAFPSVEAAMHYFGKADRARFEAYLAKSAAGYAPKRDLYFRDQFRRVLETGERPKLGVDMWQVLAEVRCPILSLRGARSDMYAADTAPKMKAANPRMRILEVPNAGHDIAGDNPEGFLAALVSFLQEHTMNTRGVDHLAIVSDDMPAAMEFYTRVLGFRLVHVRRVPYEQDRWQPPYDNLRHYFFDMGNDSLFAVFEYPKGLPRQVRDHVGGMQHVAFHVPPEKFDAMVEHVKSCGVHVVGPVPLGGRFWSAYFLDPFGTRLELATDRSGGRLGVVGSVLQTEAEARSELATLFADPAEVDRWLARMPLKKEATTV